MMIRVAWLLFWCGLVPATAAGPADREPLTRKPWTTSRLVGTPDPPPPYRATDPFPALRFEKPVHVTHAPGSDRLFVCEESGKIFSFPTRPDVMQGDLFFDPANELRNLHLTPGATGFLSTYALAFHPRFTENRLCYVCYILKGEGPNLADGTRISRFRVKDADPPRIDVASETILLTFLSGGHNGCDLQFGPDGFLYISLGDAEVPSPPDPLHTGQDITDLHASILRIDVDRADPNLRYAVPKDNPFVGLTINGKPARAEVWAYGFRNPWRMSFDRKTGELWVGDVGWETWESVHRVERGGNYGWSIVEGSQTIQPDEPIGPTSIRSPVIELSHTSAASVTGGFVYRGSKLPALVGAYVFGDWETRRMWAARIEGDRLKSLEEIIAPTVRVVGFGEDRQGELYFVDHDTGIVHSLELNDTAPQDRPPFPQTLSETGLFASVADEVPADGVYPFSINARMWQDFAESSHWIALPGDTSVLDHAEKRPIPGNVPWHNFRFHFPENAVLLKTIAIEMKRGDPASRRRLETQVLHFDGSYWHGYSYAWRDDQTDADLVPAEGAEKSLIIEDPRYVGGTRRQTWTIHSRSQCLQCHSPWTEYSLAFNLHQLNRTVGDSADGPNQLARLGEIGLLKRVTKDGEPLPPFSSDECRELPRLSDPHDSTATLNDRARSYLHVSCSSCHRFGGGGSATIDLSAFAAESSMAALTGPARLGSFDIPSPRVVAPAEPHRSVLLYRMAKFNGGRMPHLGSELVDPAGVELVGRWIASLGDSAVNPVQPGSESGWTESRLSEAFHSPATALPLAIAFGRNDFPTAFRSRVLHSASELPPGPTRDLFDGYLPQDPSRKKLGRSPRPRTILALPGDAPRGRGLFSSASLQCVNCHKLDGQGTELGPDLRGVAADRSREEILESLLEPSRRIDRKFQSYVVVDKEGRIATGLLMRRDAAGVVLRTVKNEEVRVAAESIEQFQPSRESIMPSGLLADLTPQEAADLLAFIKDLR